MTNNVVALTNVTNYSGNLQRHPADGNNIPITAIGDTSSSLTNVYVFLDLTNNLISVGQLVDNIVELNSQNLVVLCRINTHGR